MNPAPILVVDDDTDGRELFLDAWKELEFKNQLIFLNNAEEVLRYLKEEKRSPFFILCDAKIARTDGF